MDNHPMRILVAEDEAISRRLLVRVLSSMGHEVTAASDGEEAWLAFCQDPYPVVVTDWLMPGTDGLELTRRIRGARARTYPWIIMLTAMEFGANYRRTMESGVDDFLTKPLDHELLRVRLSVAERIQHMGEQMRALASVLPICMHCKAVRAGGDDWKRVEEYFHDVDFSHGYCPTCYYEHSLVPELRKLHERRTLPALDGERTLDVAVLGELLAFEDRESPGIFDDLCDGLYAEEAATRAEIDAYTRSGVLLPEHIARWTQVRRRAADLGLGRLERALAEAVCLSEAELLDGHAERGEALAIEVHAALLALREAQSLRKQRREPSADTTSVKA
jgi:CheY-like chemotaxis protein